MPTYTTRTFLYKSKKKLKLKTKLRGHIQLEEKIFRTNLPDKYVIIAKQKNSRRPNACADENIPTILITINDKRRIKML